ncbi:hypothetical protein NC653_000901 [Populus alba x Populus x berolinensis]|uniref:Uncharacterized protein n=1 Tax=Populus alba x Populus x berolinensis TaxID=444605 RepID=A0AAD6WH67_9ROSI|nr:hypothetical protein NC653_000901 [Populus alba x Populus x berolinensis]
MLFVPSLCLPSAGNGNLYWTLLSVEARMLDTASATHNGSLLRRGCMLVAVVGSNHLNVAQSAMLFPNADGDVRLLSKANQSSKDITELKNLFMASTKKIELLCEMITK